MKLSYVTTNMKQAKHFDFDQALIVAKLQQKRGSIALLKKLSILTQSSKISQSQSSGNGVPQMHCIVNHCQLLSTTKDIILCIKVLLINLQQLAPSADILDQQFLGNLFSMNANKDSGHHLTQPWSVIRE